MGDYEKFVEAFDAFIKSKDTNRNETLFQSVEHLDVDDFFLYNIKASMLNKRGNLKEAKENIEKSISLIDKTIGNMPISPIDIAYSKKKETSSTKFIVTILKF